MNVLFFVHRYWPSVGGVEKYVHELGRALVSMGHQVAVVAGAHCDGLPGRDQHDGIDVYRFPSRRSPLRARGWFLRNLSLFRRADVIHVSNTHMLECFWRLVGPTVSPRKVFLTRHGMSYRFPVPESEKRRALRSLRWAAGVVHDGAFIEKWLDVAPDICPDQGLSPTADQLPDVPERLPDSAVYIGRVEPDSGIRIYIDAVRLLKEEHHRSLRLDVYGDGSLLPALREEALRDRLPIRFHGRVPDAQEHITDACFAWIDGRMAMQEAMARRRLVLAAYVDPLKRDYVESESFSPHLVSVDCATKLAERTVYYMDHPEERRALVERAHAHARTLCWPRTAEAYVGLWGCRLARPMRNVGRWQLLNRAFCVAREARRPKSTWACEISAIEHATGELAESRAAPIARS